MITVGEYLKKEGAKTPHGPNLKKIDFDKDPEMYKFIQEFLVKQEKMLSRETQIERVEKMGNSEKGQRVMTSDEIVKMNNDLNQIFEQFQLNLNDAIVDLALKAAKELSDNGYFNDKNKQSLLSMIGVGTGRSVIFITTLFRKGFSIGEYGEIIIDFFDLNANNKMEEGKKYEQ